MSISKRVTYISSNIVNNAADTIRKELNAYWVTTDKSTKQSAKPQLYYLSKHKGSRKLNNIDGFALTEEVVDDNPRLPTKKVSMRIYGNSSVFENQTQWRAFVFGGRYDDINYNGIFGALNKDFVDNTFTCDKPFSNREARDLGGNSRIKTSHVELEYNYYQREYERMLTRVQDEKYLPNIYALYSLKEADEITSRNKVFQMHVSLAGRLGENQVNKFTDKASENPLVSNNKEYLKIFSKKMRPTTGILESLSPVHSAYQNIMLSPASVPILKYNNKKYMFPMFGELTFATDKTTQFTQILQDSSLSAVFMKDLYGSSIGRTKWKNKVADYATHTVVPIKTETNKQTGHVKYINKVISGKTTARVWNLEEWYQYMTTNSPSTMRTGVFIGQESNEIKMATDQGSSMAFYRKMIETIFIGKVRTIVKSQQRRFADIIDGDSCYSEELLYKIEKFAGSSAGSPVQTFWIANTNEVDVFNFIDTQVRYNQLYTYKATAYSVVIGARYQYSKPSITERVTDDCVEFVRGGEPVLPRVPGHVVVNNITGTRTALQVPADKRFMAEVDVLVSPHVFVVETPFFSHTSRLIDDPPLAPEIDILPYRTDSRFLKFFMQSSSGQLAMQPIIITEEDKIMIDAIRKAKNIRKKEDITYATDDSAIMYQVYRMEEAPRRYEDFKTHLRKTVSTDVSLQTAQRASAIAYVDQIAPNTKYYYMFRAIDVHNKVGAPTPVYEIEMVNDKGAFYPTIRIHNMSDTPDVVETKTGRRFIQIIPNVEQTLINEEKSGFDNYNSAKDIPRNALTYGHSAEPIWNKKFKVRLTSTKTGKKIDINLRFKTKRVKTDLEESS